MLVSAGMLLGYICTDIGRGVPGGGVTLWQFLFHFSFLLSPAVASVGGILWQDRLKKELAQFEEDPAASSGS